MEVFVAVITKTIFTPLNRYQLQLQVTSGQTSTTLKDILASKERFQGVALDLVSLIPRVVIRYFFTGISNQLFSSVPKEYLFDNTINELPVICLTNLVTHPLLSMHQQQATFNRNAGIIEVWGNLNRKPKYFFQGVFAGIIYESMVRIFAYFIKKFTFIPSIFPYLIASWILFPLRSIQSHQIDSAIFGESQSISQSVISIYDTAGIYGFWSGCGLFLFNQAVNRLLVSLFTRNS